MTDPILDLEITHGIDISFDTQFGLKGTKDVVATDSDFVYSFGAVALAEELQRLFDLTPRGSCVDDPEYGIDLDFIGTRNGVAAAGLARIACLQALRHPSFASRFRVRKLDVIFSPDEPNALRINGVLQVFGFEGIELYRFGP